jgi:hypothetical protein
MPQGFRSRSIVRRLPTAGLCLGAALALAAPSLAETVKTPTATVAAKAKPKAPAVATVDPQAVKALRDMSAFLQQQATLEIAAQTTLDLVASDDQKIQLEGAAHYKLRKPNAFVVDVTSDTWNRQYVYDGREFTLSAPKLGYFATVPAPATIQATVTDVSNRFGISLPLDDLFRWASSDGARADSLASGFLVGEETIDGAKTRHYAFREGKVDWQVWIQEGAQPLPLKLVIVDRRDPADPAYVARLAWTLNPPLTDADFAFRPAADAKRIRMILQQ